MEENRCVIIETISFFFFFLFHIEPSLTFSFRLSIIDEKEEKKNFFMRRWREKKNEHVLSIKHVRNDVINYFLTDGE